MSGTGDPQPSMTPPDDTGSWRERQRALSTFARTAAAPAIDAWLRAALGKDALDRRDAVFVAGLAGRPELLVRALHDPSRLVRRTAISLAGSRVEGAQLVAVFPSLAPDTRCRLAAAVSRARRAELARALAVLCAASRDHHAARPLVEWADEATLRRAFDEGGARAVRWRFAARRLPRLVLELLDGELRAADRDAATSAAWRLFAAAVPELVEARPSETLALLERHGPRAQLPPAFSGCWGRLLAAHPERVVALLEGALRSDDAPLPAAILRRASKLSPASVTRLARAALRVEPTFAELLGALPPSRRAQCFFDATAGLELAGRWWSEQVLAVLPHALRVAEARRMRGLPLALRDPAQALRLVRWLPEEEALPLVALELASPKAEVRAEGWALRVGLVGAARRGLAQALRELERLRNEQDPVRLAAFEALARLPPTLFTDADEAALLQLVELAVTARDTSSATRAALQRLAHRLMRCSAETPSSRRFLTSLAMLLRLAEQGPQLQFPPLDDGLRRGAEVPLVAALLPWLRGEVRHELNGNVLALVSALRARAHALPELQGLLAELIFAPSSGSPHERDRALALWLEPSSGRDARVRRVLDWDQSSVTFCAVWQHLHRHRQDWLLPFVEGRRLEGRFGSDQTGWRFPAVDGFGRWPRAPQVAFARALRRIVDDAEQHLATRARALRSIARLPVSTLADLEPLTAHEEVVIVEAALGALAWLDEGEGALAVLSGHLDGDRARVAMYAVARLVRAWPEAQLLAALDALLGRAALKVTVRKEVVRLLGPLPGQEVARRLAREWTREKAHRDVKVALLHAARARLHEASAWEVLTAAAQSGDRGLTAALLDPPARAVPPAHRGRYAELVVGLVDHPDAVVRQRALEALKRPGGWTANAPGPAAQRVSGLLLARSTEAPWPDAAVVLGLAATHLDARPFLEATVRALAARLGEDPQVSTVDQEDLPAQARLEAVCAAVCDVSAEERARTRPARTIVGAVLPDVLSAQWLRLVLIDRLPSGSVDDVFPRAPEDSASAQTFQAGAVDPSRECTPEQLVSLASALLDRAPWAALGVLGAAAERFGWSPAVRQLLGRLRTQDRVKAAARALRAPESSRW